MTFWIGSGRVSDGVGFWLVVRNWEKLQFRVEADDEIGGPRCGSCFSGIMTFSYSLSSSSRASVSNGGCRADGDYGIPRRCFCGGPAIIQTSRTTTNPGRRFFTCRMSDDGGCHIWKWWDDAMMEELSLIRLEIQEQADRITRMTSYGGLPTRKMQNCLDEVKEVKELELKNEREIARVKYVVLVGLVVVATVCYLFK